jgi:hypothetical protein
MGLLGSSLNKILKVARMVKVAVAGGTGGLGRTIVDALEASSEHDYIILSRKVCNRLVPSSSSLFSLPLVLAQFTR